MATKDPKAPDDKSTEPAGEGAEPKTAEVKKGVLDEETLKSGRKIKVAGLRGLAAGVMFNDSGEAQGIVTEAQLAKLKATFGPAVQVEG